jgi:hypothetical protein
MLWCEVLLTELSIVAMGVVVVVGDVEESLEVSDVLMLKEKEGTKKPG